VSNDRQRQDLEDIFIEHRVRLRKLAQRIVGTRELAEDVLQSAYLRVVEVATKLAIEQPLRYWFQVVRHLAIDSRRRTMLEGQVFTGELQGTTVPAQQSSPEQMAITGELLSLLEKTLMRLPARTVRAFRMYRLEGLTQRDIALRLQVSPTLVNFMIRDAVDALKGCQRRFEED
jgi:RNA polymerase sigma-70 factor (ECF subfamily)